MQKPEQSIEIKNNCEKFEKSGRQMIAKTWKIVNTTKPVFESVLFERYCKKYEKIA